MYYLATLAAALALRTEGKSFTGGQLVMSALFLPLYSDIEHPGFYPVLGVGWTLNLEMMFYALFALALAMPRRAGIGFALGAILAGVAVGRLVAARAAGPSAAGFYAQPVVLLFAFGVALAAFGRRDAPPPLWGKARLGAPPLWFGFAMALALIAALDALRFAPSHVSLVAAAAAAPLLAVAALAPPSSPSRFGAALARLGDASYSLYLLHTPLLMATNRIGAALPLPLAFPFNLVAAGGVACLGYPLLERPLRRRLEGPLRAWVEGARPQLALLTLRR